MLVFKCPDIFPRPHGRGVKSFAAPSPPFPYRSVVAVNINMKTNRLKKPVLVSSPRQRCWLRQREVRAGK